MHVFPVKISAHIVILFLLSGCCQRNMNQGESAMTDAVKPVIYYSPATQDLNRERPGFSAKDISFPTDAMNVAEVTLTARYPEKGFALNQRSEMVVRIVKGDTTFHCEGEEVELHEG